MRTAACLGLLVLLLSHSLGWSVAVLFEGKAGPVPEREEALQSHASAWHNFAELSERMQEMQLAKMPPTPLGSVLKVLGDMAKIYLPTAISKGDWEGDCSVPRESVRFAEPFHVVVAGIFNRATPPPEMIG